MGFYFCKEYINNYQIFSVALRVISLSGAKAKKDNFDRKLFPGDLWVKFSENNYMGRVCSSALVAITLVMVSR